MVILTIAKFNFGWSVKFSKTTKKFLPQKYKFIKDLAVYCELWNCIAAKLSSLKLITQHVYFTFYKISFDTLFILLPNNLVLKPSKYWCHNFIVSMWYRVTLPPQKPHISANLMSSQICSKTLLLKFIEISLILKRCWRYHARVFTQKDNADCHAQ